MSSCPANTGTVSGPCSEIWNSAWERVLTKIRKMSAKAIKSTLRKACTHLQQHTPYYITKKKKITRPTKTRMSTDRLTLKRNIFSHVGSAGKGSADPDSCQGLGECFLKRHVPSSIIFLFFFQAIPYWLPWGIPIVLQLSSKELWVSFGGRAHLCIFPSAETAAAEAEAAAAAVAAAVILVQALELTNQLHTWHRAVMQLWLLPTKVLSPRRALFNHHHIDMLYTFAEVNTSSYTKITTLAIYSGIYIVLFSFWDWFVQLWPAPTSNVATSSYIQRCSKVDYALLTASCSKSWSSTRNSILLHLPLWRSYRCRQVFYVWSFRWSGTP